MGKRERPVKMGKIRISSSPDSSSSSRSSSPERTGVFGVLKRIFSPPSSRTVTPSTSPQNSPAVSSVTGSYHTTMQRIEEDEPVVCLDDPIGPFIFHVGKDIADAYLNKIREIFTAQVLDNKEVKLKRVIDFLNRSAPMLQLIQLDPGGFLVFLVENLKLCLNNSEIPSDDMLMQSLRRFRHRNLKLLQECGFDNQEQYFDAIGPFRTRYLLICLNEGNGYSVCVTRAIETKLLTVGMLLQVSGNEKLDQLVGTTIGWYGECYGDLLLNRFAKLGDGAGEYLQRIIDSFAKFDFYPYVVSFANELYRWIDNLSSLQSFFDNAKDLFLKGMQEYIEEFIEQVLKDDYPIKLINHVVDSLCLTAVLFFEYGNSSEQDLAEDKEDVCDKFLKELKELLNTTGLELCQVLPLLENVGVGIEKTITFLSLLVSATEEQKMQILHAVDNDVLSPEVIKDAKNVDDLCQSIEATRADFSCLPRATGPS